VQVHVVRDLHDAVDGLWFDPEVPLPNAEVARDAQASLVRSADVERECDVPRDAVQRDRAMDVHLAFPLRADGAQDDEHLRIALRVEVRRIEHLLLDVAPVVPAGPAPQPGESAR